VMPLTVEFVGEQYVVEPGSSFTIGRDSDLVIDDNPYLHRHFLRIATDGGLWWLLNVGSLLSATVTDSSGQVQAWLAPGARLPLVFQSVHVLFTAGSTTYDFRINLQDQFYEPAGVAMGTVGGTTIEPIPLTSSQRLLIVALAEHVLEQAVPGRGTIPSSADAAKRLGWSMTTFNRKLDNVCEKLDRIGVDGVRGGRDKVATNRRARLVEYSLATQLVTKDDLTLLPGAGSPPEVGEA
jgi:hypothetical protein